MVVAVVLKASIWGDNFSSCRSANVRCMLCGEGGCGGGDGGGGGGVRGDMQ